LIRVTATPNNAFEAEPKHFEFSSRFKELNNLYSVLAPLHRQLYLKGTFPNFAEPRFFGSTSSDTIAERKNAIVEFLKFVLSNEVLCKSRTLQQFLEKSHLVESSTEKSSIIEQDVSQTLQAPTDLTNKSD